LSNGAHAQLSILRIFAPNGGENLVADSTTQIRWIAQGVNGRLAIAYSSDSGAVWNPIDTVTAGTGFDSLAWVVPNDTTHKALVRIVAIDTTLSTRSQRVFNIVSRPVPTLRLIYPNGGEVLGFDSTARIIWTGTNLTGSIEAAYSTDSGKTYTLINTVPARNGNDTLAWSVPHDSTTKAFVRVRLADSSIADASNRAFTIKGSVKPTIHLLYPNGSEVFNADSTIRVRWSGQDLVGTILVEYSNDSGATWKPATQRQARNGLDSMTWKIPNDSTTKALVRVGPMNGVKDSSDNVFTINARADTATPTPILTLLYPNGGEEFNADSVVKIKWIAANVTGRIGIQLSTDNGATWVQIDTATARTGLDSLAWMVPNDSTITARIRISAMSGAVRDTSNGAFTIDPRKPTVGVREDGGSNDRSLALLGAYPNPASDLTEIRWMQGTAATAEIRLYDVNGRLLRSIAAGYRSSGEQHLMLPTEGLPSGRYQYELRSGKGVVAGSLAIVR
jgi:hypothetical protein